MTVKMYPHLKHSTEPTMTVDELIDALAVLPMNLRVKTEGCDCEGSAICVQQTKDGFAHIRRAKRSFDYTNENDDSTDKWIEPPDEE